MRQTHICPKCRSTKIWVIDEIRNDNPAISAYTTLPVAIVKVHSKSWILENVERHSVGRFELYSCYHCGYSEWYAKDANEKLAEFAAIENSGVRLIDTTPQRGPFR